jgi:hypothetical protein
MTNLFGDGSALTKIGEEMYKTKDGLSVRVHGNKLSEATITKFNKRYNEVIPKHSKEL